jgi:L-alanine-DL-glutamate epimerase-like enolase superfamily enzyme
VYVRLTADDGLSGYGEAAPLASYDGVTVEQVVAALEAWRPLVEADAPLPEDGLPQALAALDLARWDLAGRRARQPVWKLLGAKAPGPVAVNATIGADDPAAAAAEATGAVARGFSCVKVKVGLGADLERVAAVRKAGGAALGIRLDANGAWSIEEAVDSLHRLSPHGIELCEEPVHGVEALHRVAQAVPVAIAADETAAELRLYERRLCAAVCLKVAAAGGIAGLLRDAALARQVGYEVYIASTLDGPLGIAAALHAAAAIAPDRPCGLATLDRFEELDPLPADAGNMRAPSLPGLGVLAPAMRKFS